MAGSALTLIAALFLGATLVTASAAPPAMPDQVPELMHRAILPVTRDAATCVAIADRPVGESDYLVVGLANGTVNVFHPSGSDMIVRVIELDLERPVDGVCAVRLAGARTDFALLALQGRTLSVMGEEVSRVKGTIRLPSPVGDYRLARVPASSAETDVRPGERALLYDDHSVFEVRVAPAGQHWGLSLEPIVSEPSGIEVHVLSDRAVVMTGSGAVVEFTVEAGAVEWTPGSAGVVESTIGSAGALAIIPGELAADGAGLGVLCRGADGRWVPRSVALEDSLTLAVTVRDSLLLLGGALTRDTARGVGWLALVDARGEVVAISEHGRAVAAAVEVGEWIAVQGNRRNLSLYDMKLRPVWDNASQIDPLALMAAHLNADESEDLVVVGMRLFRAEAGQVEDIRDLLDRPDFMRDAVRRDGRFYLDRPMLNVYYSSASELGDIVQDRQRLASELQRSREYTEAARHILTARAAAAALGHWDAAESLRSQGAQLLAMPRRERATLIAAALLLAVGLWLAAVALRGASGERRGATELTALLLGVTGLAAWRLLGHLAWSPALVAGAVVAGAGTLVAGLRRSVGPPPRRVAGAPIEELELRIKEFTHGGDGSSAQGRKKLTTLAYLVQEMLDSIDDAERYELLRERVALRYKSFYPAKYNLARELPRYAHAAGVAVAEADALASAATAFHAAMTICLDGTARPDDAAARSANRAALANALTAREDLRTAADSAETIVKDNPGCSVNACIERVLDEKCEVLDEMSIAVTKDPGLDPAEDAVLVHHSHLQFIVENLVTNALRSMDSSAVRGLSFVGTAKPSTYELRVSDTGSGISEDDLREIFIPRETDSVTGGLGLPHSRELLRRVGGNIEVENTGPGVGTTFLLTLRFWIPGRPGGQRGRRLEKA